MEAAISSAETWSERRGQMKVGFDEKIVTHYVPAYSEIYGQHPRTFVFNHDGSKISIVGSKVPDATQSTRYPREHSLALCEMQPVILDSNLRRSMSVCGIYHHRDRSARDEVDDPSDVAVGRPVLPDMASGSPVLPERVRIRDMSISVVRRLKPPVFSVRSPTVGTLQSCAGRKTSCVLRAKQQA